MDGATATSFYTESLSGSSEDNYSKDLQIITRKQAGTETYTFTVVNRDGLKKLLWRRMIAAYRGGSPVRPDSSPQPFGHQRVPR